MLSLSVTSKAQWTVFDPSNLAQSIVNSAKEIVQTSSTAQNMLNNFQETVKIYQQGKAYYDALKSVHDLVKGARKVQQTILLVGDISDIYVTHFNTIVGKNMMQRPSTNGLKSGNTSISSALERDCHTR